MSRLKSKIAATCIAFGIVANAANADGHDHTVLVYDNGFFPHSLYVDWGDTIRYINRTGGGRQMVIPYFVWDNQLYVREAWLNNGDFFDTPVYLNGTTSVNSPNSGTHDGEIIRGTAPRE